MLGYGDGGWWQGAHATCVERHQKRRVAQEVENGMGLNALRDEALRIATEHGFSEATVGEEIALMHSELSEALEDFRAGHKPDEMWYVGEGRKPSGIPSEMADVIIRVLHFSGKHGIDIEKAVAEKMHFNESRPYKHGKVL